MFLIASTPIFEFPNITVPNFNTSVYVWNQNFVGPLWRNNKKFKTYVNRMCKGEIKRALLTDNGFYFVTNPVQDVKTSRSRDCPHFWAGPIFGQHFKTLCDVIVAADVEFGCSNCVHCFIVAVWIDYWVSLFFWIYSFLFGGQWPGIKITYRPHLVFSYCQKVQNTGLDPKNSQNDEQGKSS